MRLASWVAAGYSGEWCGPESPVCTVSVAAEDMHICVLTCHPTQRGNQPRHPGVRCHAPASVATSTATPGPAATPVGGGQKFEITASNTFEIEVGSLAS